MCVYETGLLLLFAYIIYIALLLLLLSLFLFGVRAPSLSLGRCMNSKLLDVLARIVRSRINSSSCVLDLLLALIVIV